MLAAENGDVRIALDDGIRRVLLVEDSRSVAVALSTAINQLEGIGCELAGTYAATKSLLEERADRFFLAVLDLNLPDAPRGEVIDLVEQFSIPIVVLTATVDEKIRDALFRRGVADYVAKDGVLGIQYVTRVVDRMAHSTGVKVLVVDDSRTYREYLSTLLKQHGYSVCSATDGREGLALLRADPNICLVIADYNMPNMDGLAMVTQMRKLRSHDDLAIIAVSDSSRPGLLARFLKGGASDYINKPFCVEEFYCRIDQNIEMLRSIQRARDAADRDFLTGLYNRRYFFEHAKKLHEKAVAGELDMLVAMIDADHFKSINDTYGHSFGDEALVAIADVLSGAIDKGGIAARFGGEEFVCLFVLDLADNPLRCLDALRRQIADLDLRFEGRPVHLTVSIGATHMPGNNLDMMLQQADRAVYESKNKGRNRVTLVQSAYCLGTDR